MKKRDKLIDQLDFARGVADPEVDLEIRRRLTSGSEADQKEVDLWRLVAKVARNDLEREHGVPGAADAVRIAKAMGDVYLPRPEAASTLRRLVAQLAFGGGAPSALGVRSSEQTSKHSVFVAEGYLFDIRLEPAATSGSCRLDGQVSREEDTSVIASEIPVFAFKNDELLLSTFCDRVGEIHADLETAPSELHFLVEENLRVEVPLGSVSL